MPLLFGRDIGEDVSDPGDWIMKRVALVIVTVVSMVWLGGCMVIECEEYGPPEVCVVPAPPHRVVEVVHVPGPPPRPHHWHGPRHPRGWR